MAIETPPTDAGERRRSVVRSSPEVPFSGFYSRANAAAERRAAAARNAIIEWSDWTSDSHPTRRTCLRTRHYGSFLRKRFYRGSLLRAGADNMTDFLVPAPGAHPPTSRPISEPLRRWLLQVAATRAAGRSLNCHMWRRGRPGVAGAAAGAATVRPRATRRTPGAARLDEGTAVLHGTSSRLPVRRGTQDARGLRARARALQVPSKYTLGF